ncbi:MAG: SMP-30/gluconolactonase/LRE family protein [Pseudomonadota bacterium]
MAAVYCVDRDYADVGESAVWDSATQRLYWVDIERSALRQFRPDHGSIDPVFVGERLGCVAPCASGGVVIGTESGIFAFDPNTGEKRFIAAPEADRADNRFNDASTDRQGRWWLGSMDMAQPQRPQGAFWRMDADHNLTRWRDGVMTTNGLAFSPDGRTMYFSDSHPDVRTLWSAPYDPDTGTPGEPAVLFDTRQVAGRPDGGTVDADGCYWMAGVGGWQLYRLTPRGDLDMVIDMPVERPSRPMFGGQNLDTLFVTSIGVNLSPGRDQPHAGGLFAVTGLPVGGLSQPPFAG